MPESSDSTAQLADAVGRLDRRLAALELRQSEARLVEAPLAASASAAIPALPPVPFDPARARERELEKAAAIEAILNTEPRDRAWSLTTEDKIRSAVDVAVKESAAPFTMKSVKCLTSICEMVLAAPKAEQLQGSFHQLLPRIDGMGSFDIAPTAILPDGTATVTYHMFRKGYPRPDEET